MPRQVQSRTDSRDQLIRTLDGENQQLRKKLDTLSNATTAAVATVFAVSAVAASVYLYRNPTALSDLYAVATTGLTNGYKWAASFFLAAPGES